jgi:glutamate N-acetyltransferase/amino-acid N-acetyltransferase
VDAVSVVAARGFTAAGVRAGIKADGPDLAVVIADRPAVAAAVLTTNQAAAAPVHLCREHLSGDPVASAVVVNSGCANAATGAEGMANARRTAQHMASAISTQPNDVLVCSTGPIGPQLPIERLVVGIDAAVASSSADPASGTAAATAIMTTDSVTKESVAGGGGFVVGGMAKGAGMVRPDMATMLAVITTDAVVEADTLREALRTAADVSFNSLNIDGCESTNDTVILLASGASGVEPTVRELEAAVTAVCADLAMQMARDAEGASRVVTIDVDGALDAAEARYLGRLIADSALVRASFYGGDVNWGRVIGALGTAEVTLDMSAIGLAYQGETVFRGGVGVPFDEATLLARCASGDLALRVDLGRGRGRATVVTTDLTPDYVIFNGERS